MRQQHFAKLALLAAAVAACSNDTTTSSLDQTHVAPRAPASLASSTVVVSPTTPNGWAFFDDNGNGGSGSFVVGPPVPPAGVGSAQLQVTAANQGFALGSAILGGTKFADLTTVEYSTYRQTVDAGNNLAIALQFNFDADVTDANNTFQGRLVFEPYQTFPGAVTQGVWQTWNALAGKWWRTRSGPCPQSNPCTMAEVIANWPNGGVRAGGGVILKAGSGWATFTGNTDKLTIGVNGTSTTYDFEPFITPSDKDSCKDGGWRNLSRADGTSFKNQGDCVSYTNTGN